MTLENHILFFKWAGENPPTRFDMDWIGRGVSFSTWAIHTIIKNVRYLYLKWKNPHLCKAQFKGKARPKKQPHKRQAVPQFFGT